ncbi:MAG TPA: two-component regulator propeller domain-containing protein, partial [Chitinophagaceae bacterium]|nr:two-component regulator propeller domain-containing protein [Chitinophagaceae bacterium]
SIKKFVLPNDSVFQKTFYSYVYQMIASPGGDWYLATTRGIKIFNPLTYAYSEIRHNPQNKFSISNDVVYSVSLDSTGYLWASCAYGKSLLNKIDLKNHSVKFFDRFIKAEKKWSTNTLQRILTDQKGRIWITSSYSGLSLYDEKKDDFIDYKNDPFNPNSLLSNQNHVLYQDHGGIIWVGTPAYGLSYFNPDKNFFSTIYPFLQVDNSSTDTWCRAACEDKQGNLWLATGKGLAKYDSNWRLLKTFTNDDERKPALHLNSVRSLLQDETGDIWIGTAKGLNRYRASAGTMDFFNEKQGIPLSFFWMMAKDKGGGVWMGSTNGLYRYLRNENRFDDLSKDSVLSKYSHRNVQALFLDSRNRLWIGLLNVGLVIYDVDQKTQRLLTIK